MSVVVSIIPGGLAAFVVLGLVCTSLAGQLAWMRVITLSLVPSVAVGAYCGAVVGSWLPSMEPAAALCGAVVGGCGTALLGGVIDSRFVGRGASLTLLASLGFVAVLQGALTWITGGGVSAVAVDFGSPPRVLGFLSTPNWLPIGLMCLATSVAALWLFAEETWLGPGALALGDSMELAQLLGVRPFVTQSIWQAFGGSVAGVAGLLLAVDGGLRPDIGFSTVLKAFAVLVAAGTNLAHVYAYAAALILVEQVVGYFWGGQLREAVGMSLTAVVLVVQLSQQRVSRKPQARR